MTRTLLLAALAAALALPQPAVALSCAPVDFAGDYARADASEIRYRLVWGNLSRMGGDSALPDGDGFRFDATLDGYQGGSDGFATEFRAPVSVRVSCIDPWCPSLAGNVVVLAFVEQRRDGRGIVQVGMCSGGLTYIRPSPDQVDEAEACLAGGC